MPLSPPPLDNDGSVLPHDHPGIENAGVVYRRVSDQQIVMGGNGKRRLSSLAFRASTGKNGGMSIDIDQSIVEAGVDPRIHVTSPKWVGSLIYSVRTLRDLEFMVGYDPLPDNLHHGEVWGDFSRARQKTLQNLAEWFVQIPDVELRAG